MTVTWHIKVQRVWDTAILDQALFDLLCLLHELLQLPRLLHCQDIDGLVQIFLMTLALALFLRLFVALAAATLLLVLLDAVDLWVEVAPHLDLQSSGHPVLAHDLELPLEMLEDLLAPLTHAA